MICQGYTREQCNKIYQEVLSDQDAKALQQLAKEDLFFLLTVGFKRKDANREWLFQSCREVEASPNGHLDLWAREHYKSTIITYTKSIQDILVDPNVTIGIFSHTRPIAKAFLKQIKRELEENDFLKDLFPDVLYENPKGQSPSWSLDTGIIVKRSTNPKEATVEAWGIVDGQPTSKHFSILVYDDVVTKESVTTPEMIKKVTESWELSLNLGTHDGKKRYIGTRYHFNDTYKTMMDRGSVMPRVKPATLDGTMDSEPVFLSKELLLEKRRDMGPYTFGSQMLQNPVADKAMGFREEWLKYYENLGDTSKWNIYLLVDPANSKTKKSDYTVINVIGLAPDNNYYLIAGIRDRLNLTERASKLFNFVREYNPIAVGYEKYGMQSDIEHMEYIMEEENFRFDIMPLGGQVSKEDRIKATVPLFEQKRVYLPKEYYFKDHEGKMVNYSEVFKDDEYKAFPVCVHDDMLDCFARIVDPKLGAKFPKLETKKKVEVTQTLGQNGQSWMG